MPSTTALTAAQNRASEALATEGVNLEDLTDEQAARIPTAGAGLRGKALATFILDGKALADQVKEADAARKRRERETASAQRAETKASEGKGTGERDSVPFLPDAVGDGPGYFAWAIALEPSIESDDGFNTPPTAERNPDTAPAIYLGWFPGKDRTAMAPAARAELVNRTSDESALLYRILSARAQHVRVTPARQVS